MLCKIVILDFARRLNFKIIKLQRFESFKPGAGLRLVQPGDQADRLFLPRRPLLLEGRRDLSFLNVVVLSQKGRSYL
jgi:hypothetical protein